MVFRPKHVYFQSRGRTIKVVHKFSDLPKRSYLPKLPTLSVNFVASSSPPNSRGSSRCMIAEWGHGTSNSKQESGTIWIYIFDWWNSMCTFRFNCCNKFLKLTWIKAGKFFIIVEGDVLCFEIDDCIDSVLYNNRKKWNQWNRWTKTFKRILKRILTRVMSHRYRWPYRSTFLETINTQTDKKSSDVTHPGSRTRPTHITWRVTNEAHM